MRRLAVTALITLTLLAATSLPAFAEGPPAIVPSYPQQPDPVSPGPFRVRNLPVEPHGCPQRKPVCQSSY